MSGSTFVRRAAVTVMFLLVAPVELGCSQDCTFDTDCDLFFRCAGGQCLPLGISSGVDAGQRDAGRPDTGVPDAGTVAPIATLTAEQSTLAGGMWSFSATFGRDPGCQFMSMPPCEITDCTLSGPPQVRASMAGMLSLLGGSAAPVLVPAADGTYPASTGTGTLWDAGLGLPVLPELRIQAQGAPSLRDVGPFTLTLDGPYVVDVTAPDFSSLSRSAPTDVQWATDVGAGALVVVLSASEDLTPPARREVLVECSLVGTSGSVPPAAIAVLPGASASYRVVNRRTVERTVSDWMVRGRLETVATLGGGSAPAQGSVTLN